MENYLIVLSQDDQSLNYTSEQGYNKFKVNKSLIFNPITVIVQAFSEEEAETEINNFLEDNLKFQQTVFNKDHLNEVNTFLKNSHKYGVSGITKI